MCPACARTFAAVGQVHTCRPLGDLDAHFARSEPGVRAAFDEVVAAVRVLGPVEVLPQTSRIALHVRMSCADPPEEFSRDIVLHAFRLHDPDGVDADVRGWPAAAYRIGCQEPRG